MMDNHEFSVAVLRVLTDVIKKLKADQVEQLAEGKASLTFLPPGAAITFPGPDAGEVRARLAAARSRQEATNYLASLKLKKADLVSLAKQLDIAVASKDNMDVVHRKIIEGTAGAREDAAAIRDPAWGR
jgi:hypothetical protein